MPLVCLICHVFFAGVLPPIWCARDLPSDCAVPVVVVHGARDRAFPVSMARELASVCSGDAELINVPNQGLNLSAWRTENLQLMSKRKRI
jgi:pimeloyl-ACP methyl ester carboxylesterase